MVHIMIMIVGVVKLASLKQSMLWIIVGGNTSNELKFVETKEMIKGTGHDESQGLGWDVSMLWG